MAQSHHSIEPTRYQRLSRLFIILVLAGTIAVELMVPVASWFWTQAPFPGALFEQTLIISGTYGTPGQEGFPPNPTAQLVAIDGQPVANSRDIRRVLQGQPPGRTVTLTFRFRDGEFLPLETVLQSFPLGAWAALFWLPYAVALVYLSIGIWVFRYRGYERSGQSFALFCAFMALATGTLFDMNSTHFFTPIWTAAMPLMAASLVHLVLVFPEEGPLTRRWPLLRFFTYPLAGALAIVAVLSLYAHDPWAYIAPWRWSYIFLALAAFTFFALMLYTYTRTLSGIVRQQVRIILIGSLLAFVPIVAYLGLAGMALTTTFYTTLYLPPLVIFPLFIAYAILRYRLLDMDLVISRGLAYTILTAAVAGAYFLALAVVGEILGVDIAGSHPLLLTFFVVILIFVINPLRRYAELAADRMLGRPRVDYRDALQTFSRDLVAAPLELSAIVDRLFERLEPVSHSAPVLLFLHDSRAGRYTLHRASRFVESEGLDASFGQESGLPRWLAGHEGLLYMLEGGTPTSMPVLSAEEQRKIMAMGLVLFLPLRGQTRLLGWITLGPRLSGEPYSPDDLAFLAALSNQATIALENAQLVESLAQQVIQLDALRQIGEAVDLRRDLGDLLHLIYQQTSRVLPADNFYVALYDEEHREFRMAYYVEGGERRQPESPSWPLGMGLTSQIVRQRKPIVTADYLAECERLGVSTSGRPGKAWMGVPLMSGPDGQVLGVLNISSFRQDYEYTEEQIQIVEAIADQASVAIDRMRLYQEMEIRAAEIATLYEVSRTINSTLDLPIVLDLIMSKVVEILDVEAGSLLLLDDETGDLVFQIAMGAPNSQALVGRHHAIDRGIVGHVVRSGQAQIVNDVQSDPRWNRGVDRDTSFVTRSILCVPLIFRDHVIGVIEVMNHRDGSPFHESEANLLTGFAAQAAVAIENARLYTQTDQALARRVEEMSTLQRIDRELNATLDVDHVMDLTMEWALRRTDAPVGVIALYDEARRGLLLLASRGYPPGFERHRTEPWPLGNGIVGRVVRSGEAAIVPDVTRDPDYHPAQPDTRSQLSVPIFREGLVIGVINLESPELAAFDDEDLAFIQRLSDHATIAIENARLHAETQRRLRDQTALRESGAIISSALELETVLSHVAEQMGRAVDATSAYICDYEPETRRSTVLAEYIGPLACPAEQVSDLGVTYLDNEQEFLETLESGQPDISHIDDPDLNSNDREHMQQYGAKTILYIPLLVRGRLIGFTELWESRQRREFLPEELALCQGIAQQAAMALENARLYRQSQQRAEDMTLLYDISLTVSSHLALDQVLEAVYQRIRDVWDPPVFFIALYDQAEDALDFPIYVDRGQRLEPFRQRLEEQSGFSAWIVRNREPVRIRDWHQEQEQFPVQGVALGEITRSWLGVPLTFGDRMVGVLSVQDYEPAAYGADHERFLSTIASEVAIAIENARLYQQTERYARELADRAERLALVNRISLAVNSTLDLDEILQTATREMAIAFGVKQAGTIFFDHETGIGTLVAEYQETPEGAGGEVRIPLTGNRSMEYIVASHQPLAVSDIGSDPLVADIRDVLLARGLSAILIVPLLVKGKVVGTIGLDVFDEQRIFTSEEIDLAQTIANQVSMAVENVRLYQETQQRLKEVSLLFDTSAAVSRSLDMDRVLQTTAEQITAALAADGCTISTWDREENALVTQLDYAPASDRWQPEEAGAVYALADYPSSCWVLSERKPLAFRVSDADVDPVARAWMERERVRSLLMVPLVVRGEAIGLLELMQSDEEREFTATEIALCQTLANQAAAALQNANLYEGVKQANQAKSEFIDFVAHELKQPMTAMQGYAKMLTMGIGGELSDTQLQFVQVITANVDRMGKLVNDLLEISRLEAGRTKLKLAPVYLKEIVEETITNTRTEIEARHHILEVEAPEDLPPVLGDRERLVQILTNLVSNAYKYTPEGGVIRIIVDGRDDAHVPPGHLCIRVSDTGIGMSAQELAKLEEKFFRADNDLVQQQPGTGLGVSITRNLVELHGGEFTIQSEPGQGSTFAFTVPIVEGQAAWPAMAAG